MKVEATIQLRFQARTLADAGAVLDELLVPARARADVDIGGVELVTPPGDRIVTLPPVAAPAGFAPHVPSSPGSGNGG